MTDEDGPRDLFHDSTDRSIEEPTDHEVPSTSETASLPTEQPSIRLDEPRHLHPLSVPYRIMQAGFGIVPLLIIAGFVVIPILGPLGPVLLLFVALIVVLAIIGWQIAYFRRFTYQTTDNTFDIRSGVISRRHREIPYRRIQNVDISRNLLQRMVGLAQVNIETAGGSNTEAMMRYVGYDVAKRLQDELQQRKRRAEDVADREDTETPEPEIERVLYAITPKDLLVLAIASIDLRVLSIVGVLLTVVSPPFLIQLITDLPVSPLIVIIILLVGLAAISAIISGANAVINSYGFTLTQRGEELRYERGLLQRYDGSIPLDKVQTIALRENLLKRFFGYSTLAIETAGYAPGRGEANIGSESAVPIAERDVTWSIASQIEPFGDISLHRPPKRARLRYAVQYFILLAVLVALTYAITWYVGVEMYWWVLPFAALLVPIAAHYKWKCRGYHIDDEYVVTRAGFWNQVTRIVPAYRVQTVIELQTVFQRRWGLATVLVDTAGTSSLIGGDARAFDLDAGDAGPLREEVGSILQRALRAGSLGFDRASWDEWDHGSAEPRDPNSLY